MSWRRSKDDDEPPPPGPDAASAVELWRDDDGVLVSGSPDAVRALVARLTDVGGAQLAASPVAPADALAVFATGYADGATSGQYVRFTDQSMSMLEQHGAVPNGSGGFHSFVRASDGSKFAGNLEWVPTSAGPERALAFQTAAVGLALRTAVKNVEVAVARVEDKVDQVAALLRAERLGNVLGDRRTLDGLVASLDAGDPLSSADWSSVAALGPAITRDLEKLRAHLRTQVDEVDGSWRPRQRANEADRLLAKGLLTETLGLLLLAEHNFSQWQHLRIQRIADDEPDKLEAAVRQAKAAMNEHLQADQEFLDQFRTAQDHILEPRGHDGFAVIQTRALGRADDELTELTHWFAEQRLLDLDAVDRRHRPGLRDSVAGVIGAGRRRISRPEGERERAGSDDEKPHRYQWAVDGPPIGSWQTFEGTFSNVMGSRLLINADGTGTVVTHSGLSGTEELPLLWRHVEAGQIWLCLVTDDDGPFEWPDDGDMFRYVASHQQSDVGTVPVLMNDPSQPDGWIAAGGFWTFSGPLIQSAATS